MAALDELERAADAALADPDVRPSSWTRCTATYSGRPSILTEVPRFAEHAGGARVLLKREDLNHTGSHKINNVLGQALLTQRMGKRRVIAETGAGQHGVATATAAALLGLDCMVYMGEEDTRRQALNVARMRLLGAEVVPVTTGLADAQGRDQRGDARLGDERRGHALPARHRRRPAPLPDDGPPLPPGHRRGGPGQQVLDLAGRLPDVVCACVGGGSNAIGIFHAFLDDERRRAARAGGRRGRRRHRPARGLDHRRATAASCTATAPSCCRTRTARRSRATRSPPAWTTRASGRSTPGCTRSAGPGTSRSTDAEAMEAFRLLCRTEGIIPAIESAHALAGALREGRRLGPDGVVLVNLSGRGDKDVDTAATWFGLGARRGRGPRRTEPWTGDEHHQVQRAGAGRRRAGRSGRASSGTSRSASRTSATRSPRRRRSWPAVPTWSRSACRTPTR